MNRSHFRTAAAIAAGALALGTSVAYADDNSMSRLTGDSYAYFNGLDYHPGGFNTPRQATAPKPRAVVRAPQTRLAPRQRIQLADRPRITLPSPFQDDKGA